MITNPEYLPKDRLKQELRKHGVVFSPSENKDYYVQLFRDKVMGGKEGVKVRSEFSSDEEFVKQSPRIARKQQKNTPAKGRKAAAKADTSLSQVTTLSDEALSEQLQNYGESIGPITSTTRTVYERKLAKLMATGSGKKQSKAASHEEVDHHKSESFIGEWSGDDESDTTEDSEAVPPAKQHEESHTHIKKRHVREERTYIPAPPSGKGVEETEQKRRHKPSSSKQSKSARSAPSSHSTSCSNVWSIICSVLLLLVMFTVAFLVYELYTCPEEQDSLILIGWKKAGVLVVQMREMILKEPDTQENGTAAEEGESAAESEPPKSKKKKKKARKTAGAK